MINEIEIIAGELDKLSLSLDFISKEDGRVIFNSINQRVMEILQSRIIDVRWRAETVDEGILFEPLASTEDNARPYYIKEDSRGIWSWLYNFSEPVWLEKSGNTWPEEDTMENMATNDMIETKYLKIDENTHGIISVPLFLEDIIWGAYTVQWGEFGRPSKEILKKIQRLAVPIARIAWKADNYTKYQKETSAAINLFHSSIQKLSTTAVLNPYRAGFIARPFEAEYQAVEKSVKAFLNRHGIQAQHYIHQPGRGSPVINEIMNQIRSSHFGIVDISGNNPNVMLELGMLMVLGRKFLLICNQNLQEEVPYDLKIYQIYHYTVEIEGEGSEPLIKVEAPGGGPPNKIEDILTRFMEELQRDKEFVDASPWREIPE